jgi:pimeloyl-ACP methyl ester carboxylesterase/DNA-binding CsgD family transcriptional regulator
MWISHLELEWEIPEYRAFVSALSRSRTVIRYDRLGTGLSDRPDAPGSEVETLAALVDALGLERCSLLGISWGAVTAVAYAARHPERVRALALVGGFARGEETAPAALREALVATVRAHWGAGSRALSDVWIPGADAELRDRFARLQREAATAEVAADTLEAIYAADIRREAAAVTAPALVAHRRDERAIPYASGRDLAACLPQSVFVPLEGQIHVPWLGDAASVLTAVNEFLAAHDPPPAAAAARAPYPSRPPAAGAARLPAAAPSPPAAATAPPLAATPRAPATPLSRREREVLRLVADGLGDAEIAARLIVSPHTVHRHVANIRAKLRQPTRAAAAAYAARNGLI